MKKGTMLLMLLLGTWGILFHRDLPAQTPLLFDDIGAGPRAISLGQAFTAVADDPSAAYYNPAGLTQIQSVFVGSIGYQYVKPRIYIEVPPEYKQPALLEQRDLARSEDISTTGMWMGIASNLAHAPVFDNPPSPLRNLAFGVAAFVGIPELIRFWNPQRKQDPYHLRYNYGYCLLSVALSLGYRITDDLSIGAGVMPRMDIFQDTSGNYIISNLMLAAMMDPAAEDRGFRLQLITKTKMYAEWVMGMLFRPSFLGLDKRLSMGITYRRALSGYYGTGPSYTPLVAINTLTGGPQLQIPLSGRAVDYVGYNPAQVSIGLALRFFNGLTLSSDVTWKDYSKFEFFMSLPPEPRFEDTWIPRLGLEYFFDPGFESRFARKIDKIRIMGGYYYEPSPVPDMSGPMNILDSDMNVVSVGAGLDYLKEGADLLQVQAYFQVHLAKERVVVNDQDPLFGPYGPMKTGGEVYSAGISISLHL